MTTVIFFERVEELQKLTGLTHAELWNAGFNLDDMDFGIVCDHEFTGGWWESTSPYYEVWLLDRMDSHCVGYEHVEYKGKHYYTVHHS